MSNVMKRAIQDVVKSAANFNCKTLEDEALKLYQEYFEDPEETDLARAVEKMRFKGCYLTYNVFENPETPANSLLYHKICMFIVDKGKVVASKNVEIEVLLKVIE